MTKKQEANRRRWVKALRSGKYQQAHATLREVAENDDGTEIERYCCLGLASELSSCVRRYRPAYGYVYSTDNYFTPYEAVPDREFMLKEFGMTEEQSNRLADLNDKGRSFKFIAATIEKMR
jgi:hypothetical protein